MASHFYSRIAPDYGELDNATGTRSGHLFEIVENDGGIGIMLYSDDKGRGNYEAIFLNVDEAEEVLEGLRDAINRARPKNAGHEARVRDWV